jgi:hypothetical protein
LVKRVDPEIKKFPMTFHGDSRGTAVDRLWDDHAPERDATSN